MNKRDIGKEILEGLKDIAAWQRGAAKLKTTRIEMPTAKDVTPIRKRLGLSQEAFAAFLGVSIGTLRNWEQSRREPHGAARALLLIAEKKPQAFLEAFKLARVGKQAAVKVKKAA